MDMSIETLNVDSVVDLLRKITIEIDEFTNRSLGGKSLGNLITRINEINNKIIQLQQQKRALLEGNPNKRINIDMILVAEKYFYDLRMKCQGTFPDDYINIARELHHQYDKTDESIIIKTKGNTFNDLFNNIHKQMERYVEELTNAGVRKGPLFPVRRVGAEAGKMSKASNKPSKRNYF
jgi:hypothetical protein